MLARLASRKTLCREEGIASGIRTTMISVATKSNDREVSTAAMTKNVYWVLELAINPGRFEDLKTLMTAMVEATQKNELGVLNYEWAISNDQQVCHLYEHYQNSAAWETDGKPTNVGH
jgi:hypothetical protein